MSSQAKNILKKFRKAKTTVCKPIVIAKEFQIDKQKEKQNAELDPLNFVDKYSKEAEVKPGNIDEYIKIEKKEDKKDQGRPTIMGMGGAYNNFKLNFADILKARQNLGKKENTMPVLKPIVKAFNNDTKEVHKEENKESEDATANGCIGKIENRAEEDEILPTHDGHPRRPSRFNQGEIAHIHYFTVKHRRIPSSLRQEGSNLTGRTLTEENTIEYAVYDITQRTGQYERDADNKTRL